MEIPISRFIMLPYFTREEGLPGNVELAVLTVLCRGRDNHTHEFEIGMAQLSKLAGKNREHVREAIKNLAARGIIEIPRPGGAGRGSRSVYRVIYNLENRRAARQLNGEPSNEIDAQRGTNRRAARQKEPVNRRAARPRTRTTFLNPYQQQQERDPLEPTDRGSIVPGELIARLLSCGGGTKLTQKGAEKILRKGLAKHGVERCEKALACLEACEPAPRKPIGFFLSALDGDWSPSVTSNDSKKPRRDAGDEALALLERARDLDQPEGQHA